MGHHKYYDENIFRTEKKWMWFDNELRSYEWIKQIKDENDTRKKNLFLDKEGRVFFDTVYKSQKKRIFNALQNSSADSVIKFKEVLKKIINGK